MRMCEVSGCPNRSSSRGLCATHVQRKKKGIPLDAPVVPRATGLAFANHCQCCRHGLGEDFNEGLVTNGLGQACLQRGHVDDPVQRLLRRRDVVALGAEADDRRADVAQVDARRRW